MVGFDGFTTVNTPYLYEDEQTGFPQVYVSLPVGECAKAWNSNDLYER